MVLTFKHIFKIACNQLIRISFNLYDKTIMVDSKYFNQPMPNNALLTYVCE